MAGTIEPHATPDGTAGLPAGAAPIAPAPLAPHSSGRQVWSESANALLPAKGMGAVNGVPTSAAPVAVPRFIAGSAASAVLLAADGKLPELSLIEVQEPGKPAVAQAKKSRPALLMSAVGLSMVLSVFFGMYDFSPEQPGMTGASSAHSKIRQLYQHADGTASLAPFQLLLRDAERAHSRGDEAVAAAKYRQVLRMLRAEGKVKSVTDTSQIDLELEQAISTVLRSD